jgi:restriction endonuclease S subunit
VKIREICELVYGSALPKHLREKGNIPVFGSNGQIDTHDTALTKNETIIIGRKGSIGEVCFSKSGCWIIDTAYYVRPIVDMDMLYFYYKLILLNLCNLNKASSIPGLNRDDVYEIDIDLPELDEQRRIAKIIEAKLKSVEKAKQAATEQLKAAESLQNAYLRAVFEFDELPEGWENKPIAEFCSLMTGGTPSSNVSAYYENGNIPWLVSGDIHKTRITTSEKYITDAGVKNSNAKILPKDSVLIALNGQGKTRGTVALLKIERAACNQSIVSIKPDQNIMIPEYMYYNLHSRYHELRALTGDNERSGLSITKIKSIYIPYPSSIKQQKAVVEKLNKNWFLLSKIKEKLSEQFSYINALPSAILRKAFSGEL